MNLRGKRILVVGLGRTGEALTRFLLAQGARLTISDRKEASDLGRKVLFWKKQGIPVETGHHSVKSFTETDLVVLSPGVSSLPELEAARKKGIPIISEIELAFHFLKGTVIGITGSNGKSTTTTLACKILKEAGFKAFLAGNIGTPLISFAAKSRDDHLYVTEISSFQLEHIRDFKVALSVFLNITRTHLDWHPTFDDYYGAKKRLVLCQEDKDMAILNRDDPLVWPLKKETKAGVFSFSRKREVSRGCFLRNGWIILRDKSDKHLIKTSAIPLRGVHNQENVMAAALIGHTLGVSCAQMRKTIKTFEGLEHRLEHVLILKGVTFMNDSKATNVNATFRALESIPQRTVLILGGRDKGDDFTRLRKIVRERVKKVILIGEAAEKIRKALEGAAPMEAAASMKEAVFRGYSAASRDEVVLLAPACTSFDMFTNFEERGRVFKREVRALGRKRNAQRGKG